MSTEQRPPGFLIQGKMQNVPSFSPRSETLQPLRKLIANTSVFESLALSRFAPEKKLIDSSTRKSAPIDTFGSQGLVRAAQKADKPQSDTHPNPRTPRTLNSNLSEFDKTILEGECNQTDYASASHNTSLPEPLPDIRHYAKGEQLT